MPSSPDCDPQDFVWIPISSCLREIVEEGKQEMKVWKIYDGATWNDSIQTRQPSQTGDIGKNILMFLE